MLDVSKDTVMSEPEIIELVAVNVIDEPAFSAILEELAASVIVGAASLSTIVTVDEVRDVEHNLLSELEADKLRLIVSLISEMASSVGVIENVPVVPEIVTSGIVS